MKRIATILTILLCLGGADLCAQKSSVIPGELLVQLSSKDDAAALRTRLQQRFPESDGRLIPLSRQLSYFRLDFDPAQDGEAILEYLQSFPSVLAAQHNHKLEQRTLPNDANFDMQWGLDNDGSMGLEDADVDAPEAWDITTGGLTADGDTIVIAVVDDGFDLDHEDLWFWKNRGEIPFDLLDNDGNGYVDDFDGWNVHDSLPLLPERLHGTHVCGIAAARGDNGIGISGLNWNTPILPVYAETEEDDVVAAYSYIYETRLRYDQTDGAEGAFVVTINSSFGLDFADPEEFQIWCGMYDSLGSIGILCPAATINSNIDVDVFGDVPTACESPWVIGVTNTNDDDERDNAGYGQTHIDLGAPGTLILSTTPNDNYGLNTGTSMSTPHVAGTVALLFAAGCERFISDYKYNPAGMALFLKEVLLDGTDTVSDLIGQTVSGGRLNVHQSLLLLEERYCSTSIAPGIQSGLSASISPNPARNFLHVSISAGQLGSTWQIIDLNGRSLKQGILDSQDKRLDISHLPVGLYLLRMLSPGGESASASFLVQ